MPKTSKNKGIGRAIYYGHYLRLVGYGAVVRHHKLRDLAACIYVSS
jgi:hypothetical protein